MRRFLSRSFVPNFRRSQCLSSYTSVSVEELGELCIARGLTPPPGADRDFLEGLLSEPPSNEDRTHDIYRAVRVESEEQPVGQQSKQAELIKLSFGPITVTVGSPGFDVIVSGGSKKKKKKKKQKLI
jgi:hypothetical protein